MAKLLEVDVVLAQSQSIAQAVKAIGVTETGPNRELAGSLQHAPPARLAGLPCSGTGGDHRAGLGSSEGRSAGPHLTPSLVQPNVLH